MLRPYFLKKSFYEGNRPDARMAATGQAGPGRVYGSPGLVWMTGPAWNL